MFVLGIETSCDETAASVVEDGKWIVNNVISTQEKIHSPYGGVVPEIASRHHLISMIPVINEAIIGAGGMDKIDAIAVTNGPGLVGSLLVGIQTAKTLSWIFDKKIVAVNHLEAHLSAPFCGWKDNPPFEPSKSQISLLVSGGHTILFHVENGKRTIIGATRDDAAGEAFDKVAKMLGLGYPGGRIVDGLAKEGNPKAFRLPRGLHKKGGLDFSFSGLKTSVMYMIKKMGPEFKDQIPDICASFQQAAIDSLMAKVRVALSQYSVDSFVVAGGVAANSLLRSSAELIGKEYNINVHIPPPVLCTDNAAMVASAGYNKLINEDYAGLDLNAYASSLWSKRGELVHTK
jgi:tRNA N6-adenosine threonylcarbamoyltransferase